jgi:hypothetical protein
MPPVPLQKAVGRANSLEPKQAALKLARTPLELGALAQEAALAQGEWLKLRDAVTALRQQLPATTGPALTALAKKVALLETKRDGALDKSSRLSATVNQSVRALRGKGGDSKVKAQAGHEVLSKISIELAATRAEVITLKAGKLMLENARPFSRSKVLEVEGKLARAEAKVATLEAASAAMTQDLQTNQRAALEDAQRFKASDQRMADLNDVASLTWAAQVKLVGAPVRDVSADEAARNDRRLVSITVGASPENGAKMLALQLERSSPEQQLKLVTAAANHIKTIARQAGGQGVGAPFLQAIANAKGPAQRRLMDALIEELPPASLQLVMGRLVEQKLAHGEHFAVAGAMIQGLHAAGHTGKADELGKAVAASLSKLRGEFQTSRAKVDTLNGRFSRATFGFGDAIPPETLKAFRDRYLKKHAEAYQAFDGASTKYLKALEAAHALQPEKGTKAPNTPMQALAARAGRPVPSLEAELTRLSGHAEALFESKAGQKMLTAAFELQLQGEPSLLDTLMGGVGDAKSALSLTRDSAGVLARTLVAVTAGKGMDAVGKLIEQNGDLLGIPQDKVWDFKVLAARSNLGQLDDAAQKAALRDIEGGHYGPSVKALGLLLTAPGLIQSWSNVGGSSKFEQTKLAVDTLGFGADLVKLLSKGEVLQRFASKAGNVVGVVAIPLEVLSGLGELMDGKIVDGSMSLASALGAGLMMAPGGQLVGAAIILGSAVAKKLWGDDPSARAELAAEAEVKELLEFAGLSADSASVLSDVLEEGQRSMGPFISQMARHLKLKPEVLLKHLSGLEKGALRELVMMAKSMPDDGNWALPASKTDETDRSDMRQRLGGIYLGPKSLESAAAWMKKRKGMLPEGA